jgi:hypothetical protein
MSYAVKKIGINATFCNFKASAMKAGGRWFLNRSGKQIGNL